MKFRFQHKKGIALVITLVMLAVVTVMAIVFLAITRRERTSVKLAEETAVAKDMADAALERAKTEAIAGMNANGSKLHYDLFNSQAFYNPNGFTSGRPPNNTNVAPVSLWPEIRESSQRSYLELLGNLQYDPAVPVFVETNQNGRGDFRFYLDFNRNRQFETNGMLPDLDVNERPIVQQNQTNIFRFVGDPEWVGVLERPDFPHSETNRFVGRMAYLVLPAGKSLDLNFIHNQVNGSEQLDIASAQNGFSRSQGVGSWELNLAAFLRELNGNTYAWGRQGAQGYRYTLLPNQAPAATGVPFDDARALLSFRYNNKREDLDSLFGTLGDQNMMNRITDPAMFVKYQRNNVQDFGSRPYLSLGGELFFPPNQIPPDLDVHTLRGWPGSYNTNAYTDLQQLFSTQIGSAGFLQRLQVPALRGATANTGKSSYDRYTFYRMAAQLGTDSTPAVEGKIHLNFQNPVGHITNSTIPWTNALAFFTNAAELMLQASIDEKFVVINQTNIIDMIKYQRPPGVYHRIGDTLVRTNFSLTNIQVAATNFAYRGILPFMTQNEYTPTIHRILQVAVNIFDNMSDKAVNGPPYHPTVIAPLFYKAGDRVLITGYHEVTNNAAVLLNNRRWASFGEVLRETNSFAPCVLSNYYGQHWVIGVKKGHPNFNELAFRANVDVSRKLAVTRQNLTSTNMLRTNQMFIVNMANRWAMETWNPYTNEYAKRLYITGHVASTVALRDLRDGTNVFVPPVFVTNVVTGGELPDVQDWPGVRHTMPTNFYVVFDTPVSVIPERSYSIMRTPRFGLTNAVADFQLLESTPEFVLYTTNRAAFWMIDDESKRVIDFVSYDLLTTEMDLRQYLFTPPRANQPRDPNNVPYEEMFWDPTPVSPGSFLTVGHSNQFMMSAGEFDVDGISRARSDALWRSYRYNHPDKRGAISLWRKFAGLPMRAEDDADLQVPPVLTHQAPYTPTRQIKWEYWWQANDPFVHYMHEDLWRVEKREALAVQTPPTRWNIGLINDGYQPWGGNPFSQSQQTSGAQQNAYDYNVAVKDPGVRKSDDWDFPILRRPTEPNNNTNYYFPNIGTLGQVHRGTPWQTLYLKSIYRRNPNPNAALTNRIELLIDPARWIQWAGSIGTYPSRDWRLLDVFTTAVNENAARGLLGVNQTNSAAWAAVLGGVVVPKTAVPARQTRPGMSPAQAYDPVTIEPGGPEMAAMVRSIIEARTNQFEIIANPLFRHPSGPFITVYKTNTVTDRPIDVFENMGDILGAPALSVQNPYVRGWLGPGEAAFVENAWTDQAVEFIPQQILSLVRRDEPRFVVYAFGQSLKPAPRSLTTDPDFYHMCTNYQITGEVITKTTFRVEGEVRNMTNALRAVVEKYEILPPPE